MIDIEKERTDFESALHRVYGYTKKVFLRYPEGDYVRKDLNDKFDGWQLARAEISAESAKEGK